MNETRGSWRYPFDQSLAVWWAVPLRLIVGYGFIAHGLAKVSKGPSAFAAVLQALDVPAPDLLSGATILVELVGGLAVLLGAFVPVASIPMGIVLLVAMFKVHLPYGFSSIKLIAVTERGAQFGTPGYEVNLLYLACLAALALGGSGPLSIDGRRRSRSRGGVAGSRSTPMSRLIDSGLIRTRRSSSEFRTRVIRSVVSSLAAALLLAEGASPYVKAAVQPRFKAVAFDYFVLLNPDSLVPAVERVFPGKGRELTNLWRTRQFEYAWLRSLTRRYTDFSAVTEDALVFATNAMQLVLTPADRQDLLDAYLHLAPWPDAADTLRRLRQAGVRIVTISNFSPEMVRANAENAGLIGLLDALISTDLNRTYKPDPRAYRLGTDRLRLPKQDILFVAFGGWDAAGAKAFGYPTMWVNRFRQPAEELGIHPDQVSPDLSGLLEFVLNGAPVRPH